MKMHELGTGHVEWVKTAVSFAERNGYLEVPSHAKVDLISSEGKAKDISDRMIPLNKQEIRIGKGKDVQIRVKAAEEYGAGMISDRHARIICEGDQYVLENTGEYRTFVNYKQIEGKYRLMQGDIIHIGKNEPLFFIFRTRMDKIPESREWERFDVSFRHEKFECPDVKQAVGVLYFPENIVIAIENEKGIQKTKGKEKIILNKYAVSIGAGMNNDMVIMEVDFHMKDSKGESCSTHVKERMIGIVRGFGQEYTLRVLSDEAAVHVKTAKGDIIGLTDTGSATGFAEYSLTDGNIIEFLDNPGAFLIFKVEELDLNKEDHWIKTMMKIKHSEKLETPEMVRKTIKMASVEHGSVWNKLKGIFGK